jgi:hypothetical protein
MDKSQINFTLGGVNKKGKKKTSQKKTVSVGGKKQTSNIKLIPLIVWQI